MSKKMKINPDIIQKFKWGGTTKEWEEEAERLSNQLQTMDVINDIIDRQDCESDNPLISGEQDKNT
ncbi:MAG: hypothetical protein ACM3TR_03380 [Caulobacteraceae bacterium]